MALPNLISDYCCMSWQYVKSNCLNFFRLKKDKGVCTLFTVKYSVCTYYVLHIPFEISQKHCQSTIISYFKDFNLACLLNRAGWRLDFQVWVHIKVQKSDNVNFKTRDFSPLIEWVLAGVYWLLAPKQKFNISAGHSEITLWTLWAMDQIHCYYFSNISRFN